MNHNINNDKIDMERVWKEFGKNTEAGKLLYNIYGVKYRPENHINYPKLIMKTPEMRERERLEKERIKQERANRLIKATQKIDYNQGLRHYQPQRYNPYGQVDFIPHRKNQQQIQKELDLMKYQMNSKKAYANSKPFESREAKIEKLQNKFEYQERTVMPKGARLPGLIISDDDRREQIKEIHSKNEFDNIIKSDKRAELERLYNNIIKEIDEISKQMTAMKKLGKNVDNAMMSEIKERIQDMKNLEKMIEEYDKEHGDK